MTLKKSTRNRLGNTVRYIALIFFSIFAMFPMLWIVLSSFKEYSELINIEKVTYWPENFSLTNFDKLLVEFKYFTYVGNTVSDSVIGIVESNFGFSVNVLSWAGIALMGFIAAIISYRPWKKFVKKVEEDLSTSNQPENSVAENE